jgi:hypothetical protein
MTTDRSDRRTTMNDATNTATLKTYVLRREPTSFLTRWPCAICGGHTEKDDLIWEFYDADGDEHFVCDECVTAGVDAIPGKLRANAGKLRAAADDLEREAAHSWVIDTGGWSYDGNGEPHYSDAS